MELLYSLLWAFLEAIIVPSPTAWSLTFKVCLIALWVLWPIREILRYR